MLRHLSSTFNRLFLFVLLIQATGNAPALAQTPELIKDIQSSDQYTIHNEFGVTAQQIYFAFEDASTGFELYRSDGTPAGTGLFLDIVPGPESSSPRQFVTITNNGTEIVFFVANSPGEGNELWRTDGTTGGTFSLDINPGPPGSSPRLLTPFGDKLVFVATKEGEGQELWISDGSPGGTTQISKIGAGAADGYFNAGSSVGLLVLNTPIKKVFFIGDDGGGLQFFSSQGTLASTVKVTNLTNDLSVGTFSFSGSDSVGIYFGGVLNASSGLEVLHLNPANNVVTQAAEIEPGENGSDPQDFAVIGNKIILTANTQAKGREVYAITSGVQGATLLADLAPGALSSFGTFSFTTRISPLGNLAYFAPDNNETIASGIFVTDGTVQGTKLIAPDLFADFQRFPPSVQPAAGGQAVFSARSELLGLEYFSTTGTPETTFPLEDIFPGSPSSFSSGNPALFKSLNFFLARNASAVSLYSNDGTLTGTREIKQLKQIPNGPSTPRFVVDGKTSNQKVLFTARTEETGTELYATDGTPAGTNLLADIATGDASPQIKDLARLQTKTLFSANNLINGNELWVSDGTSTGTQLLKDINPGPANGLSIFFNIPNAKIDDNTAVFVADDGTHGSELWKSDGTPEGTSLIKDIFIGSSSAFPSGGNGPQGAAFGGKVVFGATEAGNNTELFVSDGTSGGTKLIKDIYPGPLSSNPLFFTAVDNSRAFFLAADNVSGFQIWVTDGTPDGTTKVTNINPPQGIQANSLNAFGSKVLLNIFQTGFGFEPWITDGTSAGTKPLGDLNPGAGSTFVRSYGIFNDKAYFAANVPPFGEELWVTDGTADGTKIFKDIRPGTDSSRPNNFLVANGKLYFYADLSTGSNLFESDGTPEGTIPLAQASSTSANSLTAVFNRGSLFYGGFTPDVNIEPFRLVYDACPDDPSKVSVGTCGCGIPEPGICGCGIADTDSNANGVIDCQTNLELRSSLNLLQAGLKKLKGAKNGKISKKQKTQIKDLKALISSIQILAADPQGIIKTNSGKSITTFVTKAVKSAKKSLKIKSKKFKNAKKIAAKDINASLKEIL
jgi:ELWxxDGT repeat protein